MCSNTTTDGGTQSLALAANKSTGQTWRINLLHITAAFAHSPIDGLLVLILAAGIFSAGF